MSNIDKFLKEYSQILYNTEKPSRYIGGEFLSAEKDFDKAEVKIALAFPDKYEIGISNFGHKILYHVINNHENFLADRIYAPENDFCELLIKNNKELYSLDCKKPLKEFDFIGFALQYELSYTTILKMLEMSGIPVLSSERDDSHPIIIAGGPCAYNPNPLSKFIDLFLIGDGEDVIMEVCQKYNEIRNLKRSEIISELVKIEGVYSPELKNKVNKRISQLKIENHPTTSVIPHFSSVHDRAIVEIRRGCGRLCRFCQSGHTSLPIRERNQEDIISLVKDYVKNTGYDEYSLLSLSSNDHKHIEDIIENLNEHFKCSGVGVSLPSQRADNFSVKLAQLMQGIKKSTITIAPEAGSQRMRDIINKNLSQEQIISATVASVQNGWDKIKFYFIIGLPMEEYSDLDGIIMLLEDINNKCKGLGLKLPKITCSISIFVPKPFTPFATCAQDGLESIFNKIRYLRDKKEAIRNVKFNFHSPRVSQLEAFLTRGDERVADFVYELYKQGSYLDSWEENINFEMYKNIAQTLGLNIEELATKEYKYEEELPWDMINTGINKEWFIKEFENAKLESTSVPCETKCSNCGVCKNLSVHKVLDN